LTFELVVPVAFEIQGKKCPKSVMILQYVELMMMPDYMKSCLSSVFIMILNQYYRNGYDSVGKLFRKNPTLWSRSFTTDSQRQKYFRNKLQVFHTMKF